MITLPLDLEIYESDKQATNVELPKLHNTDIVGQKQTKDPDVFLYRYIYVYIYRKLLSTHLFVRTHVISILRNEEVRQ